MKLRTVSLTLIALCLIILASGAQAVPTVEVTGSFFSTMPSPHGLCAQLLPWASGKPTTFTGITPYTIKVKAGPVNTNALGIACVNANWAQNIYTVTAYSKLNGTGPTSPPVAVSRFNPKYFCGLQGGGALHLLSYDVWPNIQHQVLPERQATYAIIDKKNPGKNFGILYYDNDNPLGAVSFVAKSYENAMYTPVIGIPPTPRYNSSAWDGLCSAAFRRSFTTWSGPTTSPMTTGSTSSCGASTGTCCMNRPERVWLIRPPSSTCMTART